MLSLLMENQRASKPLKPAAMALAASVALALLGNWSSVWQLMLPQNYANQNKEDFTSTLLAQNYWLDSVEEPASMVLLFGTQDVQNELWKWQYALAPVKLAYNAEIDPAGDDFVEWIRSQQVTHVLSFDYDNNIYEAACRYTSEGELYDNSLYDVVWNGDELTLEEE